MVSIKTVKIINNPPQIVFDFGISSTIKKAIIMPKIGWILLIMVAVDAEKNFKEWTIKLCPMAVVNKAKRRR